MSCGLRANRKSNDLLHVMTVAEMTNVVRSDPILFKIWKDEYKGLRLRAVLCHVLSSQHRKSVFQYKQKPVAISTIKTYFDNDIENISYKEYIPLNNIVKDSRLIVEEALAGYDIDTDKLDIKRFIVYNETTDTFGLFVSNLITDVNSNSQDNYQEVIFIEFQTLINNKHFKDIEYHIVDIKQLDYHIQHTPMINTPSGYTGLSHKFDLKFNF